MGVVDNLYNSTHYRRFAYGTPDGTNGCYVAKRAVEILSEYKKRVLQNMEVFDRETFNVARLISSCGGAHATAPLFFAASMYVNVFTARAAQNDNGQSV